MSGYWWIYFEWLVSKITRFMRSALEVSFSGIILFLLAVSFPTLSKQGTDVTTHFGIGPSVQTVFILIAAALIIYQTYKTYRSTTYDHSLVLKFQDTFDGMETKRDAAAKICLAFIRQEHWETQGDWGRVAHSDDVEHTLDFFEDIGFYLKGNKLSDVVVHHHFCHWIVIYFLPLERYISRRRQVENEPTTWEHVPRLYKVMVGMEARKSWALPRTTEATLRAKLKTYLEQELAQEDGEGGAGE